MDEKKSAGWTKQEYLAHLARTQQKHLNELRVNDPVAYAEAMEQKRTGKGPSVWQAILVGLGILSTMIATQRYKIVAAIN